MPPADIAQTTPTLPLDWFYLAIYPVMYAWSPLAVWAVLGAVTAALIAVPVVIRKKRAPVAAVNLSNCNGCGRCVNDCPYSAVTMQPRSDGASHAMEAVVNSDLCASCGICAGACPSSTPFRSIKELVTGIDMPQRPIGGLRDELAAKLEKLDARPGATRVVVFGCSCAAPAAGLAGDDVAVVDLICSGQLPPSFVEYALRNGADGVVVSGCADGDCEFRLGQRWTEERLAAKREPHLRRGNVDTERLHVVEAGAGQSERLKAEVDAFRLRLARRDAESGVSNA
jgi:coenzyme F420-reducing hydrogenase delta subunit/ferredoxin